MDTLIKWAVYGIMVAAVLASITLAWHAFVIAPAQARGAALQEAKDAPVIAGLTKQRDQAIASNQTLSAGVDELQKQARAAHASLLALNDAARNMQLHAAAAIAAERAHAQVAMNEVAKLAAVAATVPTNETEEAQCEDARGILSALAVDRRLVH